MPFFLRDNRLNYFAHVPKCGGTSVEAYLSEAFGPLAFSNIGFYATPKSERWTGSSPQHALWRHVTELFPEEMIGTRFAVVRDPAARILSSFNAMVSDGVIRWGSFAEFLEDTEGKSGYVPFPRDNHTCCQTDFIPDDAHIFRLEDGLDVLAAWLREQFDIPAGLKMPYLNQTVHKRVQADRRPLSEGEATLIRRIYAADFERFGYDPETALANPKLSVAIPPQARPFGVRSTLRHALKRKA